MREYRHEKQTLQQRNQTTSRRTTYRSPKTPSLTLDSPTRNRPQNRLYPRKSRRWHQQPLAKQNPTEATTQSQADRIATLERENKELKQILKKATAFFAQDGVRTVHTNNGQIH